MRRLGVSIYPEKSTVEEIKNYLEETSRLGFSRVFSCLLSVNKPAEEIKKEFTEINTFAHELGFEVIVDVSPRVFGELNISYKDLSFFKEIGADGIRLDAGFSGLEESIMTYNPENLIIEINMSNNVHTIDTIMDYRPNKYKLYGCHNFYPHHYSGLNLDFYKECTKRFNKYGLKTEGLPTLELHRELPLDVQIKHHIAMELVDDILISNCYPTKEELSRIEALDLDVVTFDVELVEGIPEVEKKIVLEEFHFNRGDQNDYFIRSTQSRVKYKGHRFEVFNAPNQIKRGDILIESSEYGHYAGELQIALKDMENSGKTNVVGKVVDIEHFILDEIKPWQKFKFRLK